MTNGISSIATFLLVRPQKSTLLLLLIPDLEFADGVCLCVRLGEDLGLSRYASGHLEAV